ncbi:MAG: ATP-binding protein [Chloroherpetonaceae bacterium]|nr:ATP-binding protein [Chloroherpetonaceae bacterium]MDW8438137.1 ATP-binding protein [Chloroherpetonaceae bacterium]
MLQGFRRSKDYFAKESVPKEEYERVLKERNLLLQLIDSLPDIIYAKDADGRIIVSNQKHAEFLGKHHSLEVIGKTDFDFYDAPIAEKHRQDEIVLLNSSQESINAEEPMFNKLTGETRWISTTKVVYRNEHGVAVGLFGIGRDITTRKLIEEELVKNQETFRKTVNSVPSMIYQILFRPDGTIVYPFVSDGSKAIYGIEPERIMLDASIITKMWHPDDVGEYMRRVEECRRTLKPLDMECRIALPDGKIKWLRIHSMPELETDGGLRFYGVRIDITKQKELEAELAARIKQIQDTQAHLVQTEKMSALGQMVAGIAHELNTPIGYASNNVALIRERFAAISKLLLKALQAQDAVYAGELEKALSMMQEIRASQNGTVAELEETIRRTERLFIGIASGFEQMANLVRSMRNFARLDEAQMKRADINEGIKNCVLMIGHLLKDKDIELTTEYGALPMVECFPAQLNQVFLNLIQNAIHAVEGKPDPKVRVSTGLEQGYVVVRVQDNGTGIPKNIQSKIFDPFFTTKPVGKGTGLGLSISFDIVKKHNGSIAFETEEGKGTTFIVKIPATDFLQTTK